MENKELIERSPLRILEKSTHGGLGKGNIGIIAARKGVGKTACLVHIATDQLLQGKYIIHVSFSANTSHIVKWYDDIFCEIARENKISGADDVYDKIVRNRVIMNFKQGGDTVDKVLGSLRSMIREGNFNADIVMVDGYDFSASSKEELAVFKKFAQELQISFWFSATTSGDDLTKDDNGVPKILSPYIENTALLIVLDPRYAYVHLQLVKDHDVFPSPDTLQLKLDPQTMLIAIEK